MPAPPLSTETDVPPLLTMTEAVHGGLDSDFSSFPIYQGTNNSGEYSRDHNPTVAAAEVRLAALEGAEAAIAVASGMAAVSVALLTLLEAGMRLIYHQTAYDGTLGLAEDLRRFGIIPVARDLRDLDGLYQELADGRPTVIHFEPLANPFLDVVDTHAIVEAAHAAGARVVVDNTLLTPCLFRPLAVGADLVVHSATKYMMGHGNGLAGVVCGPAALIRRVAHTRKHYGPVLAPAHAALLLQGIKTLPLRVARHGENAQRVAEALRTVPGVARVYYPGLPDDPGHALAARRWAGFGSMVGFATRDPGVSQRVRLLKPWFSLGETESLIAPYARSLSGGLLYYRLSIGLEDPEDLIADLRHALT